MYATVGQGKDYKLSLDVRAVRLYCMGYATTVTPVVSKEAGPFRCITASTT